MTQALRQAGVAASDHGFRSSFKGCARQHEVDETLSEFAVPEDGYGPKKRHCFCGVRHVIRAAYAGGWQETSGASGQPLAGRAADWGSSAATRRLLSGANAPCRAGPAVACYRCASRRLWSGCAASGQAGACLIAAPVLPASGPSRHRAGCGSRDGGGGQPTRQEYQTGDVSRRGGSKRGDPCRVVVRSGKPGARAPHIRGLRGLGQPRRSVGCGGRVAKLVESVAAGTPEGAWNSAATGYERRRCRVMVGGYLRLRDASPWAFKKWWRWSGYGS